MNANWVRKELGLAIVLILALAALGWLFYLGSQEGRTGADGRQIAVEGLLFVFVFIWNLAILPRWRSARTLCLGSLLFLLGSFADVADNFFRQPR